MKFLVYLKQIPDEEECSKYQDVDRMNESDKNILMEALNLRDQVGGTVTVLGLGPSSGEKVLKEALTYGVDRAILIEDPAFRGLDVQSAAKVMAQAIKIQKEWDLVLCGRQAIDGDAAHMAGMVAGYLQIPQICYVKEMKVLNEIKLKEDLKQDLEKQKRLKGNLIEAIRYTEEGDYYMKVTLPALIMSIQEQKKTRYPMMSDIMKTYSGEYKVEHLSMADFKEPCILSSYVQEVERFLSEKEGEKELFMLRGATEEENAKLLIEKLKEWKFIS